FILSRFIAHPLIKMKEATEQLSKGKHNVELHTERKDELGELAHSISTLSKDLKDLKIERNEFLANISHELRTPLTYIKGYIDIIQEETEQLTVLIKNLFQLAKIDQNNFMINREHIELCSFIKNAVERIRPVLAKKKVMLHVNCADEVKAFIDSERFQQVL